MATDERGLAGIVPVAEGEAVPAEERPALWRNFVLGVLNGVLFNLAFGFFSPTLVLPGLVRRLGGGNTLVSALPVVDQGGWLLPQLLVGARLQSRPRKLSLYRWSALARVCFFSALVGVVLLAGRLSPAVALGGFFLCYILFSLFAGMAGIPFQDVVAKEIPPRRRGLFFGLRQVGGGGLTLLVASPVVGLVLAEGSGRPFPQNYAFLFALALGASVLGLLSFSLVRERPSRELGPAGPLGAQLRLLPQMWRAQPVLRRFLLYRVLSRITLIAEPFYVLYATEVLGGPARAIGVYVGVVNIVQIVSFLLWGLLADHKGNRLLLRLGSGLAVGAPALALLLPPVARALSLSPTAGAYLFGLVFVLSSLGLAGWGLGSLNYLLEVLSERDRPAGLGLVNTVAGLASLLVILGGSVADWLGYQGLFLLAVGLGLAGLFFALRLPEPREALQVDR